MQNNTDKVYRVKDKNSSYMPPLSLILRGLGISLKSLEKSEILVFSLFIKYLLENILRKVSIDEEFYSRNYPDASVSVSSGEFKSLGEHFVNRGYYKGYLPAPLAFDPKWYQNRYADMAQLAAVAGNAGLEQHYIEHGWLEGRAGTECGVDAEGWAATVQAALKVSTHANLAHLSIKSARVQVLRSAVPPEAFRGGPVLGDDSLERCLRHTRSKRPADGFDDCARYDAQLFGEWIYAGFVYPHFGHMMAETIHRIIPSRRLFACRNWLFVGVCGPQPYSGFARLPKFTQQALQFLEVDPERVLVLNQDAVIQDLHIVEQGSDLGAGPVSGYLQELRAFTQMRLDTLNASIPTAPLIYVSRRALSHEGGFLGESYLEAALEAEGFVPFQPENHSLHIQMEFYRQARIIIFPEGSACHGVELFGDQMLETCLLLVRRSSHQHAFERILAPRSRCFGVHADAINLGTIAAHPIDGTPLSNFAVSVFNPQTLIEFLRKMANVELLNFKIEDYHTAVKIDLHRYIDHHRMHSCLLSEGVLHDFQNDAMHIFRKIFA